MAAASYLREAMQKPQILRSFVCAGWLAAAFLGGILYSGGRPVFAQEENVPQIIVRPIGNDMQLVMYYPQERRVYVYTNPFTGAPKRSCAYQFKLGAPGDALRREVCPADLSDR